MANKRVWTNERLTKAAELIECGFSISEVSRRMRIPRENLRNRLRHWGVLPDVTEQTEEAEARKRERQSEHFIKVLRRFHPDKEITA